MLLFNSQPVFIFFLFITSLFCSLLALSNSISLSKPFTHLHHLHHPQNSPNFHRQSSSSSSSFSSFPGQADQVITADLPGLSASPSELPFRHYAGYLDSVNGTHLFYWFFESSLENPESAPVALFLNGGPGCSSLFGALLESGPLRIIELNPHSWNAHANLLFIETPAGVGFSYQEGVTPTYDYHTDDQATARLNFAALRSFYRNYAGVYLSTLAELLLLRQENNNQFPVINFKGVALGNPMLDQKLVVHSRIQFAREHHLLQEAIWGGLRRRCCDSEDSEYSSDSEPSESESSVLSCRFANHSLAEIQFGSQLSEECRLWYLATQMHIIDYPRNVYNYKRPCTAGRTAANICADPEVDGALTGWLRRADVQRALHVDQRKDKNPLISWSDCNTRLFKSYQQSVDSVAEQVRLMLAAGVKVLLYFGDLDLACTYISGRWFVDGLQTDAHFWWSSATSPRPWFFEDQLVADVQLYREGLAYVRVKKCRSRGAERSTRLCTADVSRSF
ncbi:hypothetical protein TYRP_020559 [Tyrophagus putrescentiae]|nr:hypothetical protein TYRP_020559 [Tyrophagus putrescentiae]